ncbi:MAG: hypothetical protein AB7F94_02440 [Nitrospira sp.]
MSKRCGNNDSLNHELSKHTTKRSGYRLMPTAAPDMVKKYMRDMKEPSAVCGSLGVGSSDSPVIPHQTGAGLAFADDHHGKEINHAKERIVHEKEALAHAEQAESKPKCKAK